MGNNNQYPPHPSLIREGEENTLSRKGRWKCASRFTHHLLKRTYSLINLFSYSPRKRCAFTLAEVLITLGIIGIVAAMTMPSLIADYQKKQTVTQLKKVYSELAQAAEMAKLEYGDPSSWDYSVNGSEFFNKYLSSYTEISNTTIGVVRLNGIKYYGASGAEEIYLTALYDDADIITLPSGTQIFASNTIPPTSDRSIKRKGFVIDLNGFKRPNKFGRDLFLLSVTENGVRPMSNDDNEPSDVVRTRAELRDGPSAQGYQCNTQGRGMWCAALIIVDGWQISDDYPW